DRRHRCRRRGRLPPVALAAPLRRAVRRRPGAGSMTLKVKVKVPVVPKEDDFSSWLRSPAVTARVGLWLGVTFGLAFVTGVLSHWPQPPSPWLPFPTSPSWGYRVTQGIHVISGTAAVPLLLVKLWTVSPNLLARPPRALGELVV